MGQQYRVSVRVLRGRDDAHRVSADVGVLSSLVIVSSDGRVYEYQVTLYFSESVN